MHAWLTTAANQRRNCESQATLRGYWGSHSTEEWGNITVSSFKSQHHVGRDILITGFLVENDRPGNWFHPFFTAHEVKWSKCTAMADFYSFTRSLWHSLNDFIPFMITFHSVSVRDCGVGGARGLFAYISWLRAGAAATATKMGVVCIPTDEKMKCGITARCYDFAHFEEEFLASSDGNRCFFCFMLMAHTLPCRISCLCTLGHLYCRSALRLIVSALCISSLAATNKVVLKVMRALHVSTSRNWKRLIAA